MKNIITYKIDRVANNSLYISVQNGEVTVILKIEYKKQLKKKEIGF